MYVHMKISLDIEQWLLVLVSNCLRKLYLFNHFLLVRYLVMKNICYFAPALLSEGKRGCFIYFAK